jgi:hypothetical protein
LLETQLLLDRLATARIRFPLRQTTLQHYFEREQAP